MLQQEVWKDIVEYEGLYMVSNLGRVKSLPRSGTILQEKILSQRVGRKYLCVMLCKNNIKKCTSVHRLIAQAFIPNPDNKPQVNHKNGIKTDNIVCNLEWVTAKENSQHAYNFIDGNKDKCLNALEKAIGWNRKLSKKDIKAIFQKRMEGLSCIELAKEYSCDRSSINRIITENKKRLGIKIPKTNKKHKSSAELREIAIKSQAHRSKGLLYSSIEGKITGEFSSMHEAAKVLGADRKSIKQCCLGITKQHKGFIFKFKEI
jgi:hypothetical protein